MFGYVTIRKMDLLVRDFYQYKRTYCALCDKIGKNFGLVYRLALSWDVTFLVLLLDAYDIGNEIEFRCPINLGKINLEISEEVLDYSSFINYYLVIKKLYDNSMDENKKKYKYFAKFLESNSKYKKKLQKYSTCIDNLDVLYDDYIRVENQKMTFDDLSNAFGEFFYCIFEQYFNMTSKDINNNALKKLTFNLGKYIFLMDAYEDYNDDIRKNRFNALSTMFDQDESYNKIETHKKIKFIFENIQWNMVSSVYEIGTQKNIAIIENILKYGCYDRYLKVLKEKYGDISI